jgi:hypothetical protein
LSAKTSAKRITLSGSSLTEQILQLQVTLHKAEHGEVF